jgi:hypothetical protein
LQSGGGVLFWDRKTLLGLGGMVAMDDLDALQMGSNLAALQQVHDALADAGLVHDKRRAVQSVFLVPVPPFQFVEHIRVRRACPEPLQIPQLIVGVVP